VLLALSVILTWAYVRSGGSLLTVTLLHGVQNGLVVINRGLGMAEATWLAMGVYAVLAILLVILDRRMFLAKPATG
jgi:membrane protease YdiL (CAAX protease family)